MLSSLQSFTHLPPSINPSASAAADSAPLLLELCSHPKELHQLFPLLIKQGVFSHHPVQTKLISLSSRFGLLHQASLLLSSTSNKTPELYHTILKGHCRHSSLHEAIRFFSLMLHAHVPPSAYSFNYLLRACGNNADLERCREIHSQLIAHGFGSNLILMTAVVSMYGKCGAMGDARKMFDRMPERDLVAWNAIVAGYAQNGLAVEALEMVCRMQQDDEGRIRPSSITLVSALPAVADVRCLKAGKSIHGFAIRAGFEDLVNVSTAIIDVYAKCGAVRMARLVFDGLEARNVVSWNSMIDGYAQSGESEEAMRLYKMMLEMGIEATEVTVLAVLNACGELGGLEEGRRVHELSLRIGLGSNVSVMNALISMYSKCKKVDLAEDVFTSLEIKTRVSWNAMILGYAQNGCPEKALNLFSKMQSENVKPDSFTLVSVIPAVADVSVLHRAKWIHGYAARMCLDRNVFVETALVDMYAKCGGISIARMLFDSMPEHHVTTWNAIIDGYGSHGFGKEALELFENMKMSPVEPNDITFLCVLSACSHAGLVDEGKKQFESMKKDYMLKPGMDHYGTMVDLLGRAGRLEEAWNFIEKMPIQPSISVYGALLGACKIHKNVQLGEAAAAKLFELKPNEGGYHVLLANIYASCSLWEGVARVRKLMERKGLQKTPGCTFIELRNKLHTFYSGSTNHPQSKKIYARLKELMEEIKNIGYVPDAESIHDVEDDVQVQLLASHSEKLAIAFGLISTSPGTIIQIKKNLRVCRDCHTATKFISKVTGREIIVRDIQRFHHFKDGICSCGDYW